MRLRGKVIGYFVAPEVEDLAFRVPVMRLHEGNMVWGRVVEDIPDFCRELVAALAE